MRKCPGFTGAFFVGLGQVSGNGRPGRSVPILQGKGTDRVLERMREGNRPIQNRQSKIGIRKGKQLNIYGTLAIALIYVTRSKGQHSSFRGLCSSLLTNSLIVLWSAVGGEIEYGVFVRVSCIQITASHNQFIAYCTSFSHNLP
jgi:hypothetical protein